MCLCVGKQLLVDKQLIEDELEEIAPPFLTQHSVLPSTWNYLPQAHGRAHNMLFVNPPPYHAVTSLPIDVTADSNQCDSNMNSTLTNNNNNNINHKAPTNGVDEFGFDIHSVMTMEILEHGTKGKPINGLIETRNEEVLRRVAEMQKMVENSEKYLNEQGELVHECEMKTNTRLPWQNIDFDSDCDSMNSSKQSSNEDAPPPGVLKHSDSLVLLAESINLDLNGITKGLNLIGANGFEGTNGGNKSQENTPKPQRKVQGLSQLLSDLHSITNDLSQSESDSESVYTPNSSPIRRPAPERNPKKIFRTSFGLHSPDSSTLGPDSKDTNLREYLKLLKEASSKDTADIDLAAKKLSELYGFEIGDDTFIESDPDVIDLTAIPPPQTPDELDSLPNPLNAAPTGFADRMPGPDGDLEKFLAQVVIAPPTQKITPAKELTPEEIMSMVIPPPPNLSDDELDGKKPSRNFSKTNNYEESLYMNSSTKHGQSLGATNKKTCIEYATVDRRGPFSCCSKAKTNENGACASNAASHINNDRNFELPPRRCDLHREKPVPPERPPKRVEIQAKVTPSPTRKPMPPPNTFRLNGGGNGVYYDATPQKVFPPPTALKPASPHLSTLPPRKPNLPPIPVKPMFRNPIPLPKMINSDSRIAGIVSPRFQRHPTGDLDKSFTNGNGCTSPPIQLSPRLANGHFRFNGDCPKENGTSSNSVTILFSPQMNRKLNVNEPIKSPSVSANGSPLLESRNGHVVNVQSLMAKTDLAMSGLLMKLDQIAAQCSAAQSAGGGASIDEEKFQKARKELTETATQLVTSSKALVAAMSNTAPASLPEHLSACLTALRRITELAQDMSKHTSSPLQTRNIVLKVHDVASSFRELANVQIGPIGAGAQALQAECLSQILASLILSLKIFSP